MGNSYRSIISAFIYGLIASMPIVFLYIYKNWLLAVLSCLIPMAVSFGYKKHSSKVNKRSFLVIVLLSFFIILFLFLFAVPLIILYKQGMIVSFHNLVFLYEDETFLSDIGYTLFISILFAILGLIISIFSLRRTKNDATFDNSQDIALRIKEFFLSNNATDKNNAIDKKELNSIFDDYELRYTFNRLKSRFIIREYRNRYYYVKKNENNLFIKIVNTIGTITIIVILLIFVILLILNT